MEFTIKEYEEFLNNRAFYIHEAFINPCRKTSDTIGEGLDESLDEYAMPKGMSRREFIESLGPITTILSDEIKYIGNYHPTNIWEINGKIIKIK